MMEFLVTKAKIPRLRREVVFSSRQSRLLSEGLSRKLTMIIAPTGFGKTTLLGSFCQSIESKKRRVVWLTLDETDRDCRQLWFDAVSAIRTLGCLEVDDLAQLIQDADEGFDAVAIATALINRFFARSGEYYLVLDDYGLVSNPEVDETVRFFVKNLPPNVNLAITSDVVPDLGIPMLRLQDELVDIRLRDLRLDRDEVEYYLRESAGLLISDERIDQLYEFSGGWVVALQMVVSSLSRSDNGFNLEQGTHVTKHVLSELLITEVFERMEAESQDFLIRASLLERFTLPQAEVFVDGYEVRPIVQNLLMDGILKESSDGGRTWYTITDLFHNALDEYRKRVLPVEEAKRICAAVNEWLEITVEPEEAIRFALYHRDYSGFISLMTRYLDLILKRNDGVQVLQWLSQLPSESMEGSLAFHVAHAWASFAAGRPDEARRWIRLLRTNNLLTSLDPVMDDSYVGLIIDTIDASSLAQSGEYEESEQRVLEILERMEGSAGQDRARSWLQVTLWHTIAEIYERKGNLALAAEYLNHCKNDAILARRPVVYFLSSYELGKLRVLKGDFIGGDRIFNEGLRLVSDGMAEPTFATGLLYLGLGYIELFCSNLDTAWDYYCSARAYLSSATNIDGYLESLVLRSRIELAQGKASEALVTISNAFEESRFVTVPRGVASYVLLNKLLIDFACDNIDEVESLLEEHRDKISKDDVLFYTRLLVHEAHLQMTKGRHEDALEYLDESMLRCREANLRFIQIHVQLYRADALWNLDRKVEAMDALMDSLENSTRIKASFMHFRQESTVVEMLERFVRDKDPFFVRYRRKYERFIPSVESAIQERLGFGNAEEASVLTAKERQILILLRRGMTKRQISEHLSISQNTVKTHVRNIYSKLGIHDRQSV